MKKLVIISTLAFILITPIWGVLSRNAVNAQFQPFQFSGSSPRSYQCIFSDGAGTVLLLDVYENYLKAQIPTLPNGSLANAYDSLDGTTQNNIIRLLPKASNGTFLCDDETILSTSERLYFPQAVLIPPALQQFEAWFVQIVFLIYSFVGVFSFIFLIVLGYRYILSRGDVTKITEIRQKIIYYFIGLVLTFMAYPVTIGIFQTLGVNQRVECYNFALPGFRFFFDDLCIRDVVNLSDPQGVCDALAEEQLFSISGTEATANLYACQSADIGQSTRCDIPLSTGESQRVALTCTDNLVWDIRPTD